MKKRISIFTFLLSVFAAGLASEAVAATTQTVSGGYYYYGQDYKSPRSVDRMYVEGSNPKNYTANIADGAQVTFVAVPPPAMVVSGWGIATSGTAVQKISDWTGSTSPSYVWTGNPVDGERYLAVKFAYVPLVIAFNGGDGGSGSMAKMTGLNIDSEFTLSANEFTKTGYRFNGWKTNETKGVVFADRAALTGSAFWNGKAFDSTLYAQWAANGHSVSCELNGGAWSAGYTPPANAVYDTVFSLPAPTRIGYDFIGWKVTSGLDTATARWGTDKNPSSSVSAGTLCVNGDKEVYFKNLNPADNAAVTLTAQWQAAEITVTFNNHGGTSGGGLLDTLTVTYDAAYPALNPPAKDGHDFIGYAIGAEAYWGSDGQPTKATWDIATDCTADAQWVAKVYQVTYDENRSDGKPSVTHVTDVTYGVPTALYDGAGFSNFGCVLLGWSTSQGAKSPDDGYTLGSSVTFDGPKTLYAVWEKIYFIAYDGNGATGGTPMETSRFAIGKEGQTLAPNTYAKTGYSFFGWATNRAAALLLDRKYEDRATLPPDIGVGQGETNTLFAVWATNTYYVAFDPNGGTGPAMPVLTNTYDTAFKLPPETYSNGAYDFAGWRDDVAGVVYLNESVSNLCTVANGTNTLAAVWELNPLSAAMHCGNLRWELSKGTSGSATNEWFAVNEAGVGDGTDSCLRQTGASSYQQWLVTQVPANGTLSFSWKPTGCDGDLTFFIGERPDDRTGTTISTNLTGKAENWSTFSVSDIPANFFIHIYFDSSLGHCDIDRMTWTPEGFVPVTNAVPVAAAGLVYDGTLKTGVATGAGYMIEGNRATDAGDYTATATLTDGHVWEGGSQAPTNIAWTIAKATYDMGGITFTNETYEADGTAKSIFVSGALPPGVTVAYEGNGQTEPGTYTVTAKFAGDAKNYEAIPDKTATLTILKKEDPPVPPPEPVITNAVPAAIAGLIYDGTAKTGVVAGANYTIVGNVATNAGDYMATATVTNGVWEGGFAGPTNIAWSIAKGTNDMSGVTFPDATFLYDGEEHSFGVVGELPEGVSVVYSGDPTNRTEIGTNTVTASFVVADTNNWSEIETTLTARLMIVQKTRPVPADEDLYSDGVIGEFDGRYAATYSGWLRDPSTGAIVAQLQVKTTAARSGRASKSTLTVTPLGGKKKSYRTEVWPGGNPKDSFGVVYGASALDGTLSGIPGIPNGAQVEAAKDFAKAKDPAEKVRKNEIPQGCRTLALATADGYDCLSVTIDKNGKAKVKGTLTEGVSLSLSVQGALGKDAFAVPVTYSKSITPKTGGVKRPVTFGFVLWIEIGPGGGGAARMTNVTGDRWMADGSDVGQTALVRPADGIRQIVFSVPTNFPQTYLMETDDGHSLMPTGEPIVVTGRKWTSKKTVGSVKYDADLNMLYVKTNGNPPANLTKLKLTYAEKTGLVNGSFKLYYLLFGKLKTDSAAVTGIAVNGRFIGNVVIKKKGAMPITWQ